MAVELFTSISMFLIKQLLPIFVRRKNTVAKLFNSFLGSTLYSWIKQKTKKQKKNKLDNNNSYQENKKIYSLNIICKFNYENKHLKNVLFTKSTYLSIANLLNDKSSVCTISFDGVQIPNASS